MSGSAIFSTKSEPGTLRTFASLRFTGDRLEPSRVTAILGVAPTTAYRKGEIYKEGRGQQARGRTGVWVLSSDGHVTDADLDRHLKYLLAVLSADNSEKRMTQLHELMREAQLRADVTCFWYGKPGSPAPLISESTRIALARLPAKIETDFHTD